MTPEEHARMQELEGLVKRYRSRIAALKTKGPTPEDIETLANFAESLAPDHEIEVVANRVLTALGRPTAAERAQAVDEVLARE